MRCVVWLFCAVSYTKDLNTTELRGLKNSHLITSPFLLNSCAQLLPSSSHLALSHREGLSIYFNDYKVDG